MCLLGETEEAVSSEMAQLNRFHLSSYFNAPASYTVEVNHLFYHSNSTFSISQSAFEMIREISSN